MCGILFATSYCRRWEEAFHLFQVVVVQSAEIVCVHIHALIIGVRNNFAFQPVFHVAEYHQLFIGTERLRCPEILFQPSLTGEDQMGLMETLEYVLAR